MKEQISQKSKGTKLTEDFYTKENESLQKENNALQAKIKDLENLLFQQKLERLQLFENSIVGVALTFEGKFRDCNDQFASMVGYSKDEIIDQSIAFVSHPEDVKPSLENTRNLHEHRIEKFTIQKRYLRKDGTYFWGLTNVNEVKDLDGNTKYHLAVILDIHHQIITHKKLELTVEHLKDINQNLEDFAYIVSHDLKAPLNGINTIAQWLKTKSEDSEYQHFIRLLEERSQKMNLMIEEILNYSKNSLENENKSKFDSQSAIQEILKDFKIPTNVRIEFQGNFPLLEINITKFNQIFSNLIDNSLRYLNKEKGLLKIKSKEIEGYYQFIVYDNGRGIAEERFDKIFELYNENDHDTKSNMGIGLSLVKRIVQQYGGKIKVQSERGIFTEISFTLDRAFVDAAGV